MNDKVIQKIRKLMSLANDPGATEAERDLAMARAQAIITNHNISIENINTEDKDITEVTLDTGKFKWKVELLDCVGRANFVKVYSQKSSYRVHYYDQAILIGKPTNIEFVKELYNHLVIWLQNEAEWQSLGVHDPRNWKNNFLRAATSKIYYRLAETSQEIIDENNAHALVKNEWAKVNQHDPYASTAGKLGAGTFSYNSKAWQSGVDAGEKARLTFNKKIEQGSRELNK